MMSLFLIGGAVLLALIVIALVIMMNLREVVPTNMVHIVQRGKETISYGHGRESGNVYYNFPEWVIGLGLKVTHFKESIFQITLDNYDAQDSEQVPFRVTVAAFLKVKDAEVVSKRVATFSELEEQMHMVMRTEYVTPLIGKYAAHAAQLQNRIDNSASTAETSSLKSELTALEKKQAELHQFDDKLKYYANKEVSIDLDDGVKVNYGKFGDLLAEVKAITGDKQE